MTLLPSYELFIHHICSYKIVHHQNVSKYDGMSANGGFFLGIGQLSICSGTSRKGTEFLGHSAVVGQFKLESGRANLRISNKTH